MAKIAYSKLKLKTDDTIKTISVMPEVDIEVKQYLPVQDKLGLIGRVVEFAHEQDNNSSNPVKAEVYRDLEVVFTYTNITFTDKQKEDLPKLYDQFASSGVLEAIIKAIPEKEYASICCGVWNSIDAIYKYQNSVLGILDTIKTDYSDMNFDIEGLQEKLNGLGNLDMLKAITDQLG